MYCNIQINGTVRNPSSLASHDSTPSTTFVSTCTSVPHSQHFWPKWGLRNPRQLNLGLLRFRIRVARFMHRNPTYKIHENPSGLYNPGTGLLDLPQTIWSNLCAPEHQSEGLDQSVTAKGRKFEPPHQDFHFTLDMMGCAA